MKKFGLVLTVLLVLMVSLVACEIEAPEERARERISIDARDDAYLFNGADLYVYSDDHSTQKFHVDGATGNVVGLGYDFQGGVLDLDADNDTSITVDTDDQLDIELGGSDQVVLKAVAAADSAATNEYTEIAFTTPVDTTGTNTHNALTIDLAVGNATGGTNTLRGIQIDNITGDAQVTETAINVGTGFDVGLAVGSPADYTYVQGADSAGTGDALEIAFTSPVDTTGTNTHNALTIDLAVGNATGGTNTLTGIQIDAISGDAQVTEQAINIGSGFATGIKVPQDQENIGLPTILSVDIDIDNDSSPYTCATVADGETWFVHTVYANVLDNFATGGSNDATFDVGDGGDQDGLLDLDDAELQTADVDVTGGPAGWQGYGSDTIGAYMAAGAGFVYSQSGAAETIDCTFAGTGLASDTADSSTDITVYIVYTRLP